MGSERMRACVGPSLASRFGTSAGRSRGRRSKVSRSRSGRSSSCFWPVGRRSASFACRVAMRASVPGTRSRPMSPGSSFVPTREMRRPPGWRCSRASAPAPIGTRSTQSPGASGPINPSIRVPTRRRGTTSCTGRIGRWSIPWSCVASRSDVNRALGINNCFAVKRWPRTADWGPIVRERLGLRLVQHSLDLVDLGVDDPRAFHSELSDLGLELHSVFTGLAAYSSNLLLHPVANGRAAAEAWYRAAIDWTAGAGGLAVGGHVGAFSVADWTDPSARRERWADLRRSLDRLARQARTAGLDHLLVENLAAAREPSTMEMIRELVTDGDERRVPIRLCLDVGHMCVPGTAGPDRDPYAWLSAMGPL